MEINKKEAKLLAKVAKMKVPYKSMGQRMHQIIMEMNPQLEPSSLYGMPAYKHPRTGKIVCFFRNDKYFTFGLTEDVQFPNAKLHPHSWFIEELTFDVEKELREILMFSLK